MNNKQQPKKQWLAPKVFDLDVKDTKSGISPYSSEWTGTFSSYYPTSS